MSYIDVEKALESINLIAEKDGKSFDKDSARYAIQTTEPADVVEVVHGEWFLLDECLNEGVYCSVCGKKVYRKEYANQKIKSKYCPNCGAKMDATDIDVGTKTNLPDDVRQNILNTFMKGSKD